MTHLSRRRLIGRGVTAALLLSSHSVARSDEFLSGRRRLRFSLTVKPIANETVSDQCLWCYLPATRIDAQQLLTTHVTTDHEILLDDLGQNILLVPIKQLLAYQQKVFTLSIEIRTVGLAKDNPTREPGNWLQPSRYIESADAAIQSLSQLLRRSSIVDTAKAIFDWVSANIRFAGYDADDKGAAFALESRAGDCTEYAALVVALARANGIPARMMGGYVLTQDAAPKAQDYHNWAELYCDNQWIIVDAQKSVWQPHYEHYICFRIYTDRKTNPIGSAHRFRVTDGISLSL